MMTITKTHDHRGDALPVNWSTRTERQGLLTDYGFIYIRCIDVDIYHFAFGNDNLLALAFEGNIGGGTAIEIANYWLQAQSLVKHLQSFLFRGGQVAITQFRALQEMPGRNADKLARRDHARSGVGDAFGQYLCIGIVLRSEEHTSELQSQSNLVCRLLLEKKNKNSLAIPPLVLTIRYV